METTGQMVLASRLADGRAVFLCPDGEWVENIANGALIVGEKPRIETAAHRLLLIAQAAEAQNVVLEPYLIDVRVTNGQRVPASFREAIRAAGPTVGSGTAY